MQLCDGLDVLCKHLALFGQQNFVLAVHQERDGQAFGFGKLFAPLGTGPSRGEGVAAFLQVSLSVFGLFVDGQRQHAQTPTFLRLPKCLHAGALEGAKGTGAGPPIQQQGRLAVTEGLTIQQRDVGDVQHRARVGMLGAVASNAASLGV